MKTKIIKSYALLLLLIGSLGLSAQQLAGDFNSLIDMKAAYLDSEMEKLGYSHVKTEKQGGDSYTYWWNTHQGKCVVARTNNGRVASIAEAMNSSCDQQDGGATSDNGEFGSLIDMKAAYLDSEMYELGYSHVKTEKQGGDSYTYWWNTRQGKCVVARTSNGRVASIAKAMNSSCNK